MTHSKSICLDNAATTPLSNASKEYLISILNKWGNPSSLHSLGMEAKQIISKARLSVANFINADPEEIYFVPSGSAGNTLAVKGLTSEDPLLNQYEVFYSPTAHKSMAKACESCMYNKKLKVNSVGKIDLTYLDDILPEYHVWTPLVCIEAGNSEIGTINDVIEIGSITHKHNGILAVDATGYIPSYKINMDLWKNYVDLLIFSGHKLHALKGIGVLWKRSGIELNPLIYGTQERSIVGGTENVLGIASLGKAVEEYNYSSISSSDRDYVYHSIIKNIPDSYLIGASIESGDRLPQNLYMCFKGVEGESLMILLDMNGIQVSTGSACNSKSVFVSDTLSAIGLNKKDINSCIRLSFGEMLQETDLDYVCRTLKECVEKLRNLNTQ